MSAYSNQQFCVGPSDDLKLTLHAHPDLPHLMLTITFDKADFTLSSENEQLRAVVRQIAALFEGPALAPDQKRTTLFASARATP